MSIVTGGPNIITSNLVLCLDAANSKSYPGSGTTWFDLSGNENNGTLVNGVGYNSGNGGSLVFDGVDDFVSIGNIGSPQQFTCSFWVIPTELNKDAGNNFRRILVSSVSNNFILIEQNGAISFRVPGVSTVNYTAGSVSLNTWSQVTCVYNQNHRIIYQNGNFVQQNQIGTGTVNLGTIQITDVSAQIFKGNISNFNIYNRALTPQEINQNYNVLKSRFGL
jgi:hypothetical protein